jgi:anti-sigma regulatory factor (Ser/Thr protein kinase)
VDVANSDRLTLAPVSSSPAAARRWIAAQLADSGEALADTAVLLIGELVTNSVLHAQTEVEVGIERRDDVIRFRVEDANTVLPTVRRYGPYAGTGRGLTLVDSLSVAWGVEPTPNGKVVFFDLALSDEPTQGSHREPPPAVDVFDLDSWPDLEDTGPHPTWSTSPSWRCRCASSSALASSTTRWLASSR